MTDQATRDELFEEMRNALLAISILWDDTPYAALVEARKIAHATLGRVNKEMES